MNREPVIDHYLTPAEAASVLTLLRQLIAQEGQPDPSPHGAPQDGPIYH